MKQRQYEKLKPCPFCESKAKLIEYNGLYMVVCENKDKCRAQVSSPDKDAAIKAWNRRAK